jgi:rhodanese-related sulfurtransferase
LVILDVRTPEEYGRFCIPGGTNVPGGDLILWADELKRRRDATVVVNCAGRTRSIIGAAALARLGLANARALRNGTMGWVLAGFELEHKPARQAPAPPPESRVNATALARRIASEERIPWVTAEDLATSLSVKNRMHYVIDVRAEDEYASGHVPGSLNVPGGQAVQRADDFIAVRNAPIVFISEESARAVMAAYWYRQMGFRDVSVLDGGLRAWSKAGGELAAGAGQEEPLGFAAAQEAVRWIGAPQLRSRMAERALVVLAVGASNDFESAHLPGARWISRGWIERRLPDQFPDHSQAIVVTCADGRQSAFAARALEQMGYTDVSVLDGGVSAWSAQGFATEGGLAGCLVEPNDIVLSPSIRGNKEEMRRYLDWEVNLNR